MIFPLQLIANGHWKPLKLSQVPSAEVWRRDLEVWRRQGLGKGTHQGCLIFPVPECCLTNVKSCHLSGPCFSGLQTGCGWWGWEFVPECNDQTFCDLHIWLNFDHSYARNGRDSKMPRSSGCLSRAALGNFKEGRMKCRGLPVTGCWLWGKGALTRQGGRVREARKTAGQIPPKWDLEEEGFGACREGRGDRPEQRVTRVQANLGMPLRSGCSAHWECLLFLVPRNRHPPLFVGRARLQRGTLQRPRAPWA